MGEVDVDTLDRVALLRNHPTSRLLNRLSGPAGFLFQPVEAVDGPRVRIGDRWLLDFTSSNYLGLAHDPRVRSRAAAAIQECGVSIATPRLLATGPLTAQLEAALAGLVRREAALIFPSTLHAAHDVLALLGSGSRTFVIDEHAYPISLSAARAIAWPNGTIRRFRHNDLNSLAQAIAATQNAVVICDGFDPLSGTPAMLREIGRSAASTGATVCVDDAHGLGILGADPTAAMPYGYGGSGIVRFSGADPGNIAHVSSLSKAFGVPLAFAAGPSRFIDELRMTSSSVIHSSPPASPLVAAALATLQINATIGDDLRHRLLSNVRCFRAGARRLELPLTTSSPFPIQSIALSTPRTALTVGSRLHELGVRPVLALHPDDAPSGAALHFVITALHTARDIDDALDAFDAAIGGYANGCDGTHPAANWKYDISCIAD
jgi:8-amino-7-oxononanoate synthase